MNSKFWRSGTIFLAIALGGCQTAENLSIGMKEKDILIASDRYGCDLTLGLSPDNLLPQISFSGGRNKNII